MESESYWSFLWNILKPILSFKWITNITVELLAGISCAIAGIFAGIIISPFYYLLLLLAGLILTHVMWRVRSGGL